LQAQKRKLDELDSKMAVLQGNFSSIRSQIDTEQMKAANFERQGRPVPEESLKTLADLYANYEQTETAMHEREKETNDEKKQYQYELERYKAVKGLK
jgi:chromosome segregation ATPase